MAARVRYARTSDGVDIAYAVAGTGPPLLVFRPLLRPTFDDELAGLTDEPWLQLASQRSIVVWDHRGFGLSNAAPADYTLDATVIDVEAVVDALGLQRFDLLAHVMPCHTAIALAARHPERARRLVLWNPARPGWGPRATGFADLPDIASTHFREYIELVALRLMGWERAEVAARWVRNMLEHFTFEAWERLMDQMEHFDATPEAPGVLAPALVVIDRTMMAGGRGTAETEQYRRRFAALLPNAELAVLKGAGDVPVQVGFAPSYVDVVNEFLSAGAVEADATITSSGTATILFTDIVDSTALTERMGDARFRDASRTLDAGLREAIREAGGAAIDGKLLGDGVLATFPSAAQAIDGARRCLALSAASELGLHIGLHAGDVIREEGNVFGGAVNIASRICGLSAPGEILVSDVVRGMARSSAGVEFEDRGEQEMKGVGEPVRVYAVRGKE